MEKAPSITTSTLQIPDEENDLVDDVKVLSSKGVYCFDVTDYDKDDQYNRIAIPANPLKVADLPLNIQALLSDHIYVGDVSKEASIKVSHAYS